MLRMEASRRTLANHELSVLAEEEAAGQPRKPARPRHGLRLRVTGAQLVGCVLSLQGGDDEGRAWRVMLGQEFCAGRLPAAGDLVRVVPPWSVVRIQPADTAVIVGVTAVSLEEDSDLEDADKKVPTVRYAQ